MNEEIRMEELFNEIQQELGMLDEEQMGSVGLALQPLTGTDVC